VTIWNLFLFTGPIESYYFNYNALRNNEYSKLIRSEYIKEFPNTKKAEIYRRVQMRIDHENNFDNISLIK